MLTKIFSSARCSVINRSASSRRVNRATWVATCLNAHRSWLISDSKVLDASSSICDGHVLKHFSARLMRRHGLSINALYSPASPS